MKKNSVNKKPLRKMQLSGETVRVLSNDQLSNVAGGITAAITCTLTDGTGPFPSHGTCAG